MNSSLEQWAARLSRLSVTGAAERKAIIVSFIDTESLIQKRAKDFFWQTDGVIPPSVPPLNKTEVKPSTKGETSWTEWELVQTVTVWIRPYTVRQVEVLQHSENSRWITLMTVNSESVPVQRFV